jgi:hypothetical protein
MTTNYLRNMPYTLLNQSSSMESRNSSSKKLLMNAEKVKQYNTTSDGKVKVQKAINGYLHGSSRTAKHWTHGLNKNSHTKGKHNTKD